MPSTKTRLIAIVRCRVNAAAAGSALAREHAALGLAPDWRPAPSLEVLVAEFDYPQAIPPAPEKTYASAIRRIAETSTNAREHVVAGLMLIAPDKPTEREAMAERMIVDDLLDGGETPESVRAAMAPIPLSTFLATNGCAAAGGDVPKG